MTDEPSLFEELCAIERLRAGFLSVKQNQGSPGVDGVSTPEFESRLDEELAQLKAERQSWRYKPATDPRHAHLAPDRSDPAQWRDDQWPVRPTTEGTVQGSPPSPLLSNIVLDELDWELERRGLAFCRFADDRNIFVKPPKAAERVMGSIS